jgi:hypothetical protein
MRCPQLRSEARWTLTAGNSDQAAGDEVARSPSRDRYGSPRSETPVRLGPLSSPSLAAEPEHRAGIREQKLALDFRRQIENANLLHALIQRQLRKVSSEEYFVLAVSAEKL